MFESISLDQGKELLKTKINKRNNNNNIEPFENGDNQNMSNLQENINSKYNEFKNNIELQKQHLNNASNSKFSHTLVRFVSGQCCYISEQLIMHYIPSWNYISSIPELSDLSPSNLIQLNDSILWNDSYTTYNPQIFLRLDESTVVSIGAPLIFKKNVGREVSNIRVEKILNDDTSSFNGCYSKIMNNNIISIIPTLNAPLDTNNSSMGIESMYSSNTTTTNDSWKSTSFLYDENGKEVFWESELKYDSTGSFISSNGGWCSYNALKLSFNVTPDLYSITMSDDSSLCSASKWMIDSNLGRISTIGQDKPLVLTQKTTYFKFDTPKNIVNMNSFCIYVNGINTIGRTADSNNQYTLGIKIGFYKLQNSNWKIYAEQDVSNLQNASYSDCKTYAIENQQKIFRLNDVTSDGLGKCAVSNYDYYPYFKKIFQQPSENIYRYTNIWSINFSKPISSIFINRNGTISFYSTENQTKNGLIWNSQTNASDGVAYFAASTSCNKNAGNIDVNSIQGSFFDGSKTTDTSQNIKDYLNNHLPLSEDSYSQQGKKTNITVNPAWSNYAAGVTSSVSNPYYQVSYICGGDSANTVNMVNSKINGSPSDGNYQYYTSLPCDSVMDQCIFQAKLDNDGFLRLKNVNDGGLYCQIPNNWSVPNMCNPTDETYSYFKNKNARTTLNGGDSILNDNNNNTDIYYYKNGIYSDNERFMMKITDGQLCLYYIDKVDSVGSFVNSDGTNVKYGINALNTVCLNDLKETANNKLGAVAYINKQSEMKPYSTDMLTYDVNSSDYYILQNRNINNDSVKPFTIVGDVTLDACKQKSTSDTSITAFTFFTNAGTDIGNCSLFNSDIISQYQNDPNSLSYTTKQSMTDGTYIKKPILDQSKMSSTFPTESLVLNEMSSYDYSGYTLGSPMDSTTQYDNKISVPVDITNNLVDLTNQAQEYSNKTLTNATLNMNELNLKINSKINNNNKNIDLINMYNKNKLSIKEGFIGNLYNLSSFQNTNHIISETDMTMIQSNYMYILWCILSVFFLIIVIQIGKK